MPRTVLCALADDDRVRDVVATARALASTGALQPLFVHVAEPAVRPARASDAPGLGAGTATVFDVGAIEEPGDPAFDRGMRLLRDAGIVASEGVIATGEPASELKRLAREYDAALIVVGSRGRGPVSSVLLGSVSRTLALDAPRPVLIARPVVLPDRGGPVVCGIDVREDHAASVGDRAAELASLVDRPLVLAAVLNDDRLAAAVGPVPSAARLQPTPQETSDARRRLQTLAQGLPRHDRVESVGLDGSPATRLDALATDRHADLLVVGSPRGAALQRVIEGSTALDLLRRGRSPLVIVPSA